MTQSISLRRFKRVVGTIVEDEFDGAVAVRWADQPYPRPPFPFLVLKVFAGPTALHLPRVEAVTLPDAVRVTFAGATAGSERILDINAQRYRVTGNTDTAHRDAMLVAVGQTYDDIAAEAVGDDALDVTATVAGGLWRARTVGATVAVLSSSDYLVTSTSCRVSVSVNAHNKAGQSPDPTELLASLMDALHDESTRQILRANRIGFSALASGGPRDLSYVEGVDIEARSQRDLEFTIEARRVRTLTPIETVETRRSG